MTKAKNTNNIMQNRDYGDYEVNDKGKGTHKILKYSLIDTFMNHRPLLKPLI